MAPTWSVSFSTNHRFPSGPVVTPEAPELVDAIEAALPR